MSSELPQLGAMCSGFSWLRWFLPLWVTLIAAIHLYTPPTQAGELEVIPDSVEYAVAGREFAASGRYQIRVNGLALPPRYPPGFSTLFLAPVYALAPGNIGNGIVVVWLAGVACALAVYLIGARLGGPWAGVIAFILLMREPTFHAYCTVIMTDIPALAIGLWICWIYLIRSGDVRRRDLLLMGIFGALSVSLRPLTAWVLAPLFAGELFRLRRDSLIRIAILCMPMTMVMTAIAAYQHHVFGNWRRSGYQFWLAVPYDYASLVFSPKYLKDNLRLFAHGQNWIWLALGILGVFLGKYRPRHISAGVGGITRFILLAAVPISAVHLFYFFTDLRFHLLIIAMVLTVGGIGIGSFLGSVIGRRCTILLPVIALAALAFGLPPHVLEEGPAVRLQIVQTASALLPQNALLISAVDPAYLEDSFARGTSRAVLPLDRAVPYASAILNAHRIARLDPPPRNAADHACPGLLSGGGKRLYDRTADEATEQLAQAVMLGRPVYIETLSSERNAPFVDRLRSHFSLLPASPSIPWLLRLTRPNGSVP